MHASIIKQKDQKPKRPKHEEKAKKKRKQDLSFPASVVAFPDRRGVGTQRTKDRLIFPNFTFSLTATSLFWTLLQAHFVLFFDDLVTIA